MKAYIDSGLHVDNVKDRLTAIEDELGEPDIVFYEGDTEEEALNYHLLLFYPIMYGFLGLLLNVRNLIGNRIANNWSDIANDEHIVETLQSKFEIPSMELDLDKREFVERHKLIWIFVNWVSLISAVFFTVLGLLYFMMGLNSIDYFLIGLISLGFAAMSLIAAILLYIWVLQHPRNRHMAEVVSQNKANYERACLIMGGAHHNPVGSQLEEVEGVDVLNPKATHGYILDILFNKSSVIFWGVIHRVKNPI